MEKSADAFRTISEVAADLALPQHVLRFWETRFPQIRPLKRAGGRRYYRPADVGLLRSIRHLLYDEGYTIKGVQRLLKEQGARGIAETEVGSPRDRGEADGSRGRVPHDEPLDMAGPADEGDDPLPPIGPSTDLDDVDRDLIRQALDCIEECERILGAVLSRG